MGVPKAGKYYSLAMCFIGILVILSSCKDKDYPPATPVTVNLNVINATADTLNYFINGTRQNNNSALYSGGATNYLPVPSGTQNYSFKKQGSPNVLFSTSYTLDTGKYQNHSIFIGGEAVDKTFLVDDNLNAAAAVEVTDTSNTTGVVKFVNASPSIGPLNFVITKGAHINLTNCSFKYVSPYMLVKDTIDEVKVYQSGGVTPIVDTTFTFQSNTIYTLFAKGVLNGNGTSGFSLVQLNIGTVQRQ